jgi:hypothetical protein
MFVLIQDVGGAAHLLGDGDVSVVIGSIVRLGQKIKPQGFDCFVVQPHGIFFPRGTAGGEMSPTGGVDSQAKYTGEGPAGTRVGKKKGNPTSCVIISHSVNSGGFWSWLK